MSDRISFDLIEFDRLNYQQWIKRYKGSIRVSVAWKKIKKKQYKSNILIATKKTKIYLPHWKSGDWRDGEPVEWQLGNKTCLCRVPAIKRNDNYFLLDGYHRLSQKNPAFLMIDYIEPSENDLIYFTDFFNRALFEKTKKEIAK